MTKKEKFNNFIENAALKTGVEKFLQQSKNRKTSK